MWGSCPTTPGKLADYKRFLSLWSHPIPREGLPHPWHRVPRLGGGGTCDFYSHMAESSNPVSKLPAPPPPWVQSAIQWGLGMMASWVPIRLCPRKKGSGVPSWEFLPLQSSGARQAGAGQYWGAGAPDPPGAPGLAWDFMCWTLARIFFWCPARVTPIRSRSLGKKGELGEAIGLPGRLS